MKRTIGALAFAILATTAMGADDHAAILRHGGRLAESGAFHMELVARGRSIEVFVSDADGRPVPATGFTGIAILVLDGKAARIPLAPAGTDRLAGTGAVDLGARPKGAVQITPPGGRTASGSFN